MTRYAIAIALFFSGLAVGVVVTAVIVGVDRSGSDHVENIDAISAGAPEKEILLRLMAPDDGCWTRTIMDELAADDEISEGCGSVTFSLPFREGIMVSFERMPPASWTWCLSAAVDGKVVLTRGPDSNPDYSMDVTWSPADVESWSPGVKIEPVTCAEG